MRGNIAFNAGEYVCQDPEKERTSCCRFPKQHREDDEDDGHFYIYVGIHEF